MKDIKPIIAENLALLRKNKGLTQVELAERLDYSDKAISRWERGDTLPDINTLYEICEFYSISLDDLVHRDIEEDLKSEKEKGGALKTKIAMCALAVTIVWLIATVFFVYFNIIKHHNPWEVFIWSVPLSAFVVYRMTRSYRGKIFSICVSSIMIWTLLTSFYIHFLDYNIWLIFIIGVPSQIILYLWFNIKSFK